MVGRRDGGEAYADGNTSQGAGDGGVNFNLAYEWSFDKLVTGNLTPERINSTDKIESYYREMYKAFDFLDYVYAKAFLQLTPEEQSKVGVQIDHPNGNANTTRWTVKTEADFNNMKLKTVEDLWDNKIVIKPGITSTAIRYGGGKYGYESIYPTRWYQPHNDNGNSDCYSFKLLAWEMLGVGGYDGGYATYYSRRSANDLDAIKKVTGKSSWKEYKMSRYNLMQENWNNISYIDADEIYNEYIEALKLDAKNNDRNATESMNVKRRIYHYLKRVTNDFRTEVFKNNPEITHIKTAEQFKKAITDKPYGYFVLDNDIDVSSLSGTNAIIDGNFYGKLDGKGHKIKGNTLPIFQKLRFAYITNIQLDNTNIVTTSTTSAAALAQIAEYATVKDITANNASVIFNGTLKDGKEAIIAASAISYIDNVNMSVKKNNISSVEDFLKISDDPGKIYTITKDIDFAGHSFENNVVIPETFTGKIEGNGHTISNLKNSTLFANFRGTVQDLNIKDFTNESTGNFVTAFTKESYTATFKNMKFENITLSGANNVAVVTGMDGRNNANSTFDRITIRNANVTGTGVYVSTFIGRKYGGKVTNCYVQGTMQCTTTECGGIIGASHQGIQIENVVANVNVRRTSSTDNRNNNGGFIGNVYDKPSIKNCISIGNMTGFTSEGNEVNVNKFAGCTEQNIISYFTNCYELKSATGTSSVTANTVNNLKEATSQNLRDKNFYKNILKFDEAIWDLDYVSTNGYPELK